MGVVFSNLRVVMAERNLSIKDINEKTNLSRTTISNLVNNNANGVQYDTLKQLCEVLDCNVGDIIKYSIVDVYTVQLDEIPERVPTQDTEEIEWYKEKNFNLSVSLFGNDKNLMTAATVKIQEGYHDKEKQNIIQGIFFEDKLQKRITSFFGSTILTDAFMEEILKRIVLQFKDLGFHSYDSTITYGTIVY